ncbi:HAUS augmin-like complex subunit 1 isoform X1 [Parasteatoda tepidariorum]|uniref:HAUS augmin-like complex subunit 1 isoform X1 n=2 Tax=Parasteatoda tepidariorum TaxID=114398 RepID=UPI001C721398|nr:AUGMIN subunit 1 isoform X1 [Parasteatoda tepidariorum]
MSKFEFNTHKRVLNYLENWLMQLHGDEVCSSLQPDAHDLEYLLSLKSQNEESEKNVREEIKLKRARIHSFNTNIGKLKALLNSEDASLSEDTWKQIDCVAGLAAKMNIEELDLTNFLLAICEMKNENFKNEEQKMINCALMSSYSQKSLKIRNSNDILKSQLNALTEVVDTQESNKEKMTGRTKFFNTKSAEYERDIKLFKERLKVVSFEESLQHSNLVESLEVIKVLEEKLKVSKDKLKSYINLPPNESLTRLKVEEKKEELKQLELEFMSLLEKWENRNDSINNTGT